VDSDIVILTSGIARKPGQSRLDLAQTNVNITKTIIPEITRYAPNATYIIVSNPVDILTYAFIKASGLPERQVIGSGTILDTSRLKAELGDRLCISPKHVHAHVYGEHGDSSFVPWSLATVANCHIDKFRDISPNKAEIRWNQDYAEMEEFVKVSGARIIENKGATFYAVAMAVCQLCKRVLSDVDSALTVSTMMHGEYGVDDVCLSVLTLVDRSGVRGKILNDLTDEEVAKLQQSAAKLRSVIDQIEY
jgi:L-lactate dehydrogenase